MNHGLGLAWLPLTSALILPFTFLVTYVWAVLGDHVEPDFPYISSTGAYPPESCFFAQMLNISALLLGVTIWVRHHQVVDHCNKTVTPRRLPKHSKWTSWIGYAATLGISLVGNFQSVNILVIHMLGATLAFGVGSVYLWLQAYLSWSLVPHMNSRGVAVLRLVSAATATAMNITTIVFSILHSQSTKETAYWTVDRDWWHDQRISWGMHVAATVSEWVLAGTFVVFLFTLVPEFKRVVVTRVRVEEERDRRQAREEDVTNRFNSTETVLEDTRF